MPRTTVVTDINSKDAVGNTALNRAAAKGLYEDVVHLADLGANLSLANDTGFTPVNSAALKGHYNVVRHLIERGADYTTLNKQGFSPLMNAAKFSYQATTKLLLQQPNINTDSKDHYGNTALHHAVQQGNYICVRLLLESRAKANEIIHKGRNRGATPLDLASRKDIIGLLKRYGAVYNRKKENDRERESAREHSFYRGKDYKRIGYFDKSDTNRYGKKPTPRYLGGYGPAPQQTDAFADPDIAKRASRIKEFVARLTTTYSASGQRPPTRDTRGEQSERPGMGFGIR